jgi:ankyrin repeat protein
MISKGANPSVGTSDHSTPLMVAAGLGTPLTRSEDDLQGSAKGDPIDAIKLFLKAGADVNATNDPGFTAMHYAAQLGRNRMVELLAANGAKLDVKNKADKTPLDLASGPARASTAALIKQLMAK